MGNEEEDDDDDDDEVLGFEHAKLFLSVEIHPWMV
jgi:hypothetical protein